MRIPPHKRAVFARFAVRNHHRQREEALRKIRRELRDEILREKVEAMGK